MSKKKLTLSLEKDVVQDNIPSEVLPGLFIGSIHSAFNQEALLDMGITHILNASRFPSTFPKTFTYLSIDIRDKEDANILSSIPAANIFIEAGVESGGVLVHCYGGRSRSAAFICAFLMSSYGWPYERALETIQSARPITSINAGFEAQLRAYIYSNYDVYVAQQVLLLGRVRALQKYRAIRGTSENELEIKASQRKKFGLSHVMSAGGGRSDGKKKAVNEANQDDSHSGVKRSWRSAKDVEDKNEYECKYDNAADDEEEYDDEMDCEEQMCRAAASVMSGNRRPSLSNDVVIGDQHQLKDSQPSHLRKHIPLLDPRSPRCRLSRPGSTTVRIIPPLRGLERVFCCSWCQFNLFNLASVIRTDLDLRPLRDMISDTADEKNRNPFGGDAKEVSSPSMRSQRRFGGSSSQAMASPKPSSREPRTTRHREAKRFDFEGFGESPSSTPSEEESAKGSAEDSKMEVEESSGVEVPPLSFGTGGHAHSGNISTGGGSGGLSVPPRHNGGVKSARGLQVHLSSPGSGCMSPLASPRIPIPPNQRERSSFSYPSPRDRPQSVEKTRWLARVNLLGIRQGSDCKKEDRIDKMSQDDDEAIKLGFGREKYIHVEYLEWMGEELLSGEVDQGELTCGQCRRIIGTWDWRPHPKHTLHGQLEPPLIRVHKNVVQEVDVPLDATPSNTPRLTEDLPPADKPSA